MSKELEKFLFHKHLTLMQCRKDIIFQNDFINQRIKNKNISFLVKYNKKIKQNKKRLMYLAGFCVIFSLGPIYDRKNLRYEVVFQSTLYHRASSFVFDRADLPALKELETSKVNYKSTEAKILGEYFLKVEQKSPAKEITASMFAMRVPEFAEQGDSPLDVNSFVSKCLAKGIKIQDLPFA